MRSPIFDRTRVAARRDPVIEWLRLGQPQIERRTPAPPEVPGPPEAAPAWDGRDPGPLGMSWIPAAHARDAPSPAATALWCAGCGEPIEEDQTVLRVNAGVARGDAFSHLLMRPDVYLHAGEADASGLPGAERWCVTEQGIARAIALLRLHGLTGASTR